MEEFYPGTTITDEVQAEATRDYLLERQRQNQLIQKALLLVKYVRASDMPIENALELVQADLEEIQVSGLMCEAILEAPYAVKH